MGNNNAVKVHGKGTIEIHFTLGKKLILINVLHVPEIRKNLILQIFFVREDSRLF